MANFKRITLFALHGTFGRKDDWRFLDKLSDDIELVPLSLFEKPLRRYLFSTSLEELASRVQDYCEGVCKKGSLPIFLGYSLGGRIGLHLLEANQSFWKGAFFVSAHPGLVCEKERREREKSDDEWAMLAKTLPCSDFISLWNAQTIFIGTKTLLKKPLFTADEIAHVLHAFSLAKQKNFAHFLQGANMPLYWCVGEKDKKFVQLANSLKNSHFVKVWIAKQCAHRLPWDQPEQFKDFLLRRIFSYDSDPK